MELVKKKKMMICVYLGVFSGLFISDGAACKFGSWRADKNGSCVYSLL